MSLTICAQCGNPLTGSFRLNYDIVFSHKQHDESNRVLCSRPCVIAFLQALKDGD